MSEPREHLKNPANKKRSILVVGDWFVDEHWIVATESSETSSHIGKNHYRSKIKEVKTKILSLTGAGGIARLLNSIDPENIDIYGIGYWDPKDTNFISAFIWDDGSIPDQTPHTLRGMTHDSDMNAGGSSNNFCKKKTRCLKCDKCAKLFSLSSPDSGTMRVLRIYSQLGIESSQLLHRCDFNFLSNPDDDKYFETSIKRARLGHKNIDIVIVVDHKKGCITNKLISRLYTELPNATWYVRTKDSSASLEWLETIKDKLALMVTGPMLLNLESDAWFLGKHLSSGAISWLCDKAGNGLTQDISHTQKLEFNSEKSNLMYPVIAFHDDNNMAAIIPKSIFEPEKAIDDDSDDPFILSTYKVPDTPTYKVGRASVLYTSLISSFEKLGSNDKEDKKKISQKHIKDALEHAYCWCKDGEAEFRVKPSTLERYDSQKRYNEWFTKKSGEFLINESKLGKVLKRWNEAYDYDKLGIVEATKVENNGKIQLWRAWSPIKGYISFSSDNRKALSKLVNAVMKFKSEQNPKHSLSCLISGAPGLGKSYLVEKLSSLIDIEYREFNITQLASIDDLMACFDTISSIQTQKPGEPLLVFWDEINAPLASQSVYSYFLGPIWNGVYRRGGQTFQLRPCIWIFAGTFKDEKEILQTTEGNNQNTKGSDFLSRINGPKITLFPKASDNKEQQKRVPEMEQLYMAVSLVKRRFPDTIEISERILNFFRDIKPKYGIRSIEFIISQFKNINHDKLGLDSLPQLEYISTWINNSGDPDITTYFDDKNRSDKETFVRIFSKPPVD